MILSHKHKFLFLKTHKTAGSSVELFLSQFCGPEDIITPLTDEDEKLRGQMGLPGPQNCYKSFWNYGRDDILLALLRRKRRLQFFEHSTYDLLIDTLHSLGQDTSYLDSYFKFCFERNPYDKLVSAYFFRQGHFGVDHGSFLEFLRLSDSIRFHATRKIWWTEGGQAVDFIGRFENLYTDLHFALQEIGLDVEVNLPRVKAHFRTDRSHYSKWYPCHASREYVRFLYEFELEHLGYTFEEEDA